MDQKTIRWVVLLGGVFLLGLVVGTGIGSSWVPSSLEDTLRRVVPLFTICASGMFGVLFTLEIQGHFPLEVRSHWGGLGGGIGGVSLSPAILQLFLAMFFGGLTIIQLGRDDVAKTPSVAPQTTVAPTSSPTMFGSPPPSAAGGS